MPSEFQKALPVLEKIKEAGFEAYFVGGSVRDALLNRPIHDVDIATSSYPEETKQIFPRTADIGIEHGTVLVLDGDEEYEVTDLSDRRCLCGLSQTQCGFLCAFARRRPQTP